MEFDPSCIRFNLESFELIPLQCFLCASLSQDCQYSSYIGLQHTFQRVKHPYPHIYQIKIEIPREQAHMCLHRQF